jgi:eukaryotic-like serine/threonine-protein kinase
VNNAHPSAYPAAGEVVSGKYRIDRVLGEGGMGAVVRATHLITRAPVALKFMSPTFMRIDGAVERFLKEGEAAGRIRSEHVVQIYDVDKLKTGAPYIAMECLDGKDLQQIIEQEGPTGLPIERAVVVTVQVLRGLQAAHASGIVHRDMKPSNCFAITRDGEADFVKILDFGISKVSQTGKPALTKTNSALGTPLYMAPEQASAPRDVDHRCDLYSVGVILYELLCGRTPFTADSGELTELLFKLFTAEIPPLRGHREAIPVGLAEAVHHALARDPLARTSSALAFAEEIAAFGGPRSAALLEKMRMYVAPTFSEDGEGQTAAIDAFKQLEGKAWTLPATAPETLVDIAFGKTNALESAIPPPGRVPGMHARSAQKTARIAARGNSQAPANTTPLTNSVHAPGMHATTTQSGRRLAWIAAGAVSVIGLAGAGVFGSRTWSAHQQGSLPIAAEPTTQAKTSEEHVLGSTTGSANAPPAIAPGLTATAATGLASVAVTTTGTVPLAKSPAPSSTAVPPNKPLPVPGHPRPGAPGLSQGIQ